MKKQKKKTGEDNPWPGRIRLMREHQQRHATEWDRNMSLVYPSSGMALSRTPLGLTASSSKIPYGWGVIRGLITATYVHNPDCYVTSRGQDYVGQAKKLTDICRWDLEDMSAKFLGNLALQDACIYGYGALIEVVETEKQPVTGEDEYGAPTDEVKVTAQNYRLRRVHPKDILFDPQGLLPDLSDHRYVAIATYPTVASLKADPSFSLPESTDSWESLPESSAVSRGVDQASGAPTGPTIQPYRTSEKVDEYRSICLWEIWDKVGEKVVYLTDFGAHVVKEMDWPFKLEVRGQKLFPVTLLWFNARSDRFYPLADMDLISGRLSELEKIDSIMQADAISVWRKFAAVGGLLDSDQKAFLTDVAEKHALIEVDPAALEALIGAENMGQFDITKVLAPIAEPGMQRDQAARYQILEGQIQHLIGSGPSARFGLPSTRSAREAMFLHEGQQEGQDVRFDSIAEFYRLLCCKHIQILQQTMAKSRWARDIPDLSQPGEWFSYDQEQITGEWEFDVVAGSSGPKTTESKKSQELQFAQSILPILLQLGYDPRPLLTRLMFLQGIGHPEDVFSTVEKDLQALAMTLMAFGRGQAKAEQVLEAAAAVVQSGIPASKLQALKTAVQAQAQSQNEAPTPPMSAGPPSPGGPPGVRGEASPLATQAGIPEPEQGGLGAAV